MPRTHVIRAWREEQGCTASELGEQIDRSGSLILKIETGIEPITLEVAIAVSRATGIDISDLLTRKIQSDVKRAAEQLSASQ